MTRPSHEADHGSSNPEQTLPLDGSGGQSRQARAAVGTIPGYEILNELSRGGQGIVYKAVQKSTKRKVAIKVLLGGADAAEESRRRFQREIELLAKLRHPNIVSIFEAGVTGEGRHFFVMDFLEGESLDQFVSARRLTTTDTLELFATVCDAVHYAHRHGIIHRDLKPRNILVDAEGNARVLDFGLARPLATSGEKELSITHAAIGTLPYMAPEQAAGDALRVDARTDVYALGITLYRLLTGQHPYATEGSLRDVLINIQFATPREPRSLSGAIDLDLDTILLKCLAKEPARRYQSADELAKDIRAHIAGRPISARRDRLSYIARKQAAAWVHRHPLISATMIVLLTVWISKTLLDPLVGTWTTLDQRFNRAVTDLVRDSQSGTTLGGVRVVGFTDETPLAALAAEQGIEGVNPNDLTSLRLLHARLFELLAEARPRVVASDIFFRSASKFDIELARGIEALSRAGIPVVLGVPQWWADETGIPQLSPALRPLARWGCVVAGFDTVPWQVQLVLRRGPRDPLPSLSLASVAAYRHPEADASYQIDEPKQQVHTRYHPSGNSQVSTKAWLAESDELPLSVLTRAAPGSAMASAPGVIDDDLIGIYLIHLPPEKVLLDSTLSYERVFRATPEERWQWFNGRVVLIGNLKRDVDQHRYGPNDLFSGCYAHAVAIEGLIGQMMTPRSRPRSSLAIWDRVICGAMGAAVALFAWRRQYLLIPILCLLPLLIAFVLAEKERLLWNPMVPILVLVTAWAAATILKLGPSLREGRNTL